MIAIHRQNVVATLLTILLIMVALGLSACNEIKRPVVVGAKDFAEQQIVAHLVAQSLQSLGISVEVEKIPRDSIDAIGALWLGDIDVYVEYTGSALALAGHPPVHDAAESYAAARAQLASYDLSLGPLLGFRNDYKVLARPGSSVAQNSAISELAKMSRLLKVGMTSEFRKRPLDGYEAFARRYGLRTEPALVVPSSPEGKDRLYAALIDGRIDIAIGFSTDPQIRDFDLSELQDSLGFFPAYAAAPLTREQFLTRRPEVAAALKALEGSITSAQMQSMVAQVSEQGSDPFKVAAAFFDPSMTSVTGEEGTRSLKVSTGNLDAVAGQSADLLLALRKSFPQRRIEISRYVDPLSPLIANSVRYALLSGPDFFTLDEKGVRTSRAPVDAIAAVGFDIMHLLVRGKGTSRPMGEMVQWGVGNSRSTTARTAEFLIAGSNLDAISLVSTTKEGKPALQTQAEQVREGILDGVLVMAEPGHPWIEEELNKGLMLEPIEIWEKQGNQMAFPFLQTATIPIGTYQKEDTPVLSFGSQTVLSVSRSDPAEMVGVVGPGSAAIGRTLPVGSATIARIRDALGVEVRLDPSLPMAISARRPPPERPEGITQSPLRSFINFMFIIALILIFRLFSTPHVKG